MKKPVVSIVIVSNRLNKLINCVKYVKEMYPISSEVIIIWDGNKIEFNELKLLFKDEGINIIFGGCRGVSNGRNLGIKHSNGKFIAFTDDDCIVSKNWLHNLLRQFTDINVAGVGSIRQTFNTNNVLANYWQLSYIKIGSQNDKYISLRKNIYLCTSSAVYRKHVLSEIGGFDKNLISGEDVDLSKRIKQLRYKLVLEPKAILYHEHPITLRALIKQQYWYGNGYAQLIIKNKLNFLIEVLAKIKNDAFLKTGEAFIYKIKNHNQQVTLFFPIFVLIKEVSAISGMIIFYIRNKKNNINYYRQLHYDSLKK